MYEFPPDLLEAIKNNYLVNPSGLPGHWHELDLLQEHFNYWLKCLFNCKSLDFDSNFLREVVGLNLRGFCDLRERMMKMFGARKPGRTHTDTSVAADINRLGVHYRLDAVMQFRRGREQPYDIPNEFVAGSEKLQNGLLDNFIRRTAADHSTVNDDIFKVCSDSDMFNCPTDCAIGPSRARVIHGDCRERQRPRPRPHSTSRTSEPARLSCRWLHGYGPIFGKCRFRPIALRGPVGGDYLVESNAHVLCLACDRGGMFSFS